MMLRRRSYSRPGIVERTGGSFDIGGVWQPANYGPYTYRFNHRAYDRNLHALYYNLEDDYYGSYCDLLEYERALRLNQRLSEQERLHRWRMRLAFEELEEAERLRRYRSMAHHDRIMLGLTDNSWWGERYGNRPFHHRPDWHRRFSNRIQRWEPSFLPLSTSLHNRYAPVWNIGSDLATDERRMDLLRQAENEEYRNRLVDSERRFDHQIRNDELNGRRLAHENYRMRERLEDDILRDEERAMENRMMDDALYNQERNYDRELLYDQENRIRDDMAWDRERDRFEDRLEDDAIYRAEERLDDDSRYLQGADIMGSELADQAMLDYPEMQLGLDDDMERHVLDDDLYERERVREDLLY